MSLPWIEKYRPKNLSDVIGNKEIINNFKNIVKNGNLPHMFLMGKPGIGKTTSIICLAKELLGNKFNDAFLELNASDQRGIDTVRNTIISFCKKFVSLPPNRYKIIFLDEVESMTTIAQQALRRIIEKYTNNTRFILACNSSSQIIDAIQSRCILLRFSKIKNDEMESVLKNICNAENVSYDDSGIHALVLSCDGDARFSINALQTIANTFDKIDSENVSKIIDKPDYLVINNIIDLCIKKEFEKIHEIIEGLIIDGYLASDIIQLLFKLVKDYNIDIDSKIKYLDLIGKTEINLIKGGDPTLQLMALIARIIQI